MALTFSHLIAEALNDTAPPDAGALNGRKTDAGDRRKRS
jgi:hypothetical protein